MKTPAEIVKAAYEYMVTVMQLQASKITNPRVEEISQESPDGNWNVVISYDIVGDFAFDKIREYKQFVVNVEGMVLEMKIKKI